ncbi:hypothetical protein DNFV4_01428 [Nitrospira tepida]|uniref:DUF4382 domain-containing protein n=1 Tax=Nitrospira tepida TaxID=2973512 RepID=A0AA86T3G2_9BACT|nr:DUF4382 domain-containing protein [Nitrospira tepida]CAI4030996.1 hypothetical protein DNFV4_01428 [Nitrospira tepida]
MNTTENHSTPLIIGLMGVLLTALIAGCGSNGGDSTQPGVLSVSLTDAPACGFDEVNVTVGKVRVHQSDNASDNSSGWADITLDPPRKINLLDLNDPTQPNFALEHLGEAPLAAGHYTQLRLVLVPNSPGQRLANSVVLSGQPSELALDTPSGVQTGIKLIHQFTVDPGQRVDLLLDFDACQSVVKRSNNTYALKPVIKAIPFALNGIEGFLDQSLTNVVVSAQMNGAIVRATVPNSLTGKFFLARLDPAQYDVVITADNHATAVIAGVPVTSDTSTTIISTQAAPILLQASTARSISGTVTLNPSTDDPTVFVAAKQSLNGGPVVTVKSQPATLVAGNPPGDSEYALMLPSGAPSLGQYSPTLPITLNAAAQSAVAGKYTMEASAIGYATQTAVNVDISAADATQNFLLSP